MNGEDEDRSSTEPAPPPDEPADDIFADFVRNANQEWVASVEALLFDADRAPALGQGVTDPDRTPLVDADLEEDGDEHTPPRGLKTPVLLTRRKSTIPPPDALPPHVPAVFSKGSRAPRAPSYDEETTVRKSSQEIMRDGRRSPPRPVAVVEREPEAWASVVSPRSHDTQRREAVRVVPDVASVPPPPSPPPEGVEDGLMPGGEMDRKLTDMGVLLRYGHEDQVQAELEALRMQYPDDLLLLRRVAELYVGHGLKRPALEALFKLASELFERRNVEGMRQALEQALVLDPANGRANRLLALLDQEA